MKTLALLRSLNIPEHLIGTSGQGEPYVKNGIETAQRYGDYGQHVYVSEDLQSLLDKHGLYLEDSYTYGEGFEIYSK